MKTIAKILLTLGLALCGGLSLGAQNQKIDKKNLVIKEWNTDAKSNAKFLDHITTYNADGQKLEEIEYYSDGSIKWRERYEYGSNGKIAKTLVYDGRNKLVNIKKYEYNEFNRRKTAYTYDAKGRLKTIKVFEYLTQNAE